MQPSQRLCGKFFRPYGRDKACIKLKLFIRKLLKGLFEFFFLFFFFGLFVVIVFVCLFNRHLFLGLIYTTEKEKQKKINTVVIIVVISIFELHFPW